MKGLTFQKPLELNLQVEGESWNQNSTVTGKLVVRNRGSATVPLENVGVTLAVGRLKAVHTKAPNAFKFLVPHAFAAGQELAVGAEAILEWSFPIEANSQITDSYASPFLVYGAGANAEKPGQLQLPVHPEQTIQEFLKALTITFRFVVKTTRSAKGRVDVKLAPPAGRAFAALEFLQLSFRFEGDALNLRYSFLVKKVEPTAVSAEVKIDKTEVEQQYEKSEYLTPSGRYGFERIEAGIQEALLGVERK